MRLVSVLYVAVLVGVSCSGDDDENATPAAAATTTTSTTLVEEITTGALVSAEPLNVPDVNGDAWRVTYTSQRIDGEPVEVTGLVVRPRRDPPPGGFPVFAWGHGTTGVADACVQMNSFDGHLGIPALQQRLDAGYVVAATDYEGIGGPGTHPYMVAESEARSLFDIVRALPAIQGVDASPRTVLAGFSQGGHAVLAAAARRAELAPDLDIVGVVALASASDLARSVPAMFSRRELAGFGMMIAVGWADTYPDLELTDVVAPDGMAAAEAARTDKCLGELEPFLGDARVDDLWVTSPARLEPWAARIAENDLDAEPIDLPVFVAGGGRDILVVPTLVDGLVDQLCGAGLDVEDRRYPDAGHGATVDDSVADVHAWIAARLAGEPAPSSC